MADDDRQMKNSKQWDVFLSYAHADRAEVALPLATLLQSLGLTVWLDHAELKVGDSLQEKIDEGLRQCRLGVVVLSKSFFSRHYPKRELRGLAQREVNGEKVILPVWHKVSEDEVREFSPPLADRVAARTEDGIKVVALKIFEAANPQLVDAAKTELREASRVIGSLMEISTGSSLMRLISGTLAFNFGNEDPGDAEEVELISGFLQYIQDLGDVLGDFDVGDRVKAEFNLGESIKVLRKAGWMVFGRRGKRKVEVGKEVKEWPVAMVVLVRQGAGGVVEIGGGGYAVIPEGKDLTREQDEEPQNK